MGVNWLFGRRTHRHPTPLLLPAPVPLPLLVPAAAAAAPAQWLLPFFSVNVLSILTVLWWRRFGKQQTKGKEKLSKQSGWRNHYDEAKFPMYVVSVDTLLNMGDRMIPHEQLLAEDKLIEWGVPGNPMDPCLLVSHAWLSLTEPDPEGVQFRTLQGLLKRARSGATAAVPMFWQEEFLFGAATEDGLRSVKWVWLDYFSCPQAGENRAAQARAIASIASYVADCTYAVALVPPGIHRERGIEFGYGEYTQRGWCRLERIIVALNGGQQAFMAATSATSAFVDRCGSREWFLLPPGKGHFTVDADKAAIGAVLSALLDEAIDMAKKGGKLFWMRFLMSVHHQVLAGLPLESLTQESQAALREKYDGSQESLQRWMALYRFKTVHDGQDTGFTPFRYAMYEGRYHLARGLIAAGADVEAPLRRAVPGLGYHNRGATILHSLAWLRDDPEGIQLLLDSGADVTRRTLDDLSVAPLQFAAVMGHGQNIDALACDDIGFASTNGFGDDVPGVVMFGGHADLAKRLYAAHADLHVDNQIIFGWRGAIRSIVCNHGDSKALQAVIDLGAEVDARCRPERAFARSVIAAMQLRYRLTWRAPSEVTFLFSQLPGATALGVAALFGLRTCAALLLAQGADPALKNDYGRTAVHLAAIRGHFEVVIQLLQACDEDLASDRDAWGKTYLDYLMGSDLAELRQALLVTMPS